MMEASKYCTKILWYQILMLLFRMKRLLMCCVFYILVPMVYLSISSVKLISWLCRVIRHSHICLFCSHGVVNLKSCAQSASIYIKNKLRVGFAVTHRINLYNSNFQKNTQSARLFRAPELHNVNDLLTLWCRSRRVDIIKLTKIKRLLDTNSSTKFSRMFFAASRSVRYFAIALGLLLVSPVLI